MSLVDKLRRDALHEVTAGGYEWQIRRVSDSDMSAAKHTSLMVLSRKGMAAQAEIMAQMQAPGITPERVAALQEQAEEQAEKATLRAGPQGVAKIKAADVAIVCAAVVAFRPVGEADWTPVRIVPEDNPPPTDAEGRGLLPIRDLPPGAEALLASEAGAWAAGGAAGVEALRTFRHRLAGNAPSPAPAGEGVRDEAVDPVAGG